MSEGCVRWYNTKLGYGFVKLHDGRDVFVHSTNLNTEYPLRMLFKGEYVMCDKLEETDKGLQSLSVSGCNNGELLCVSNKQLVRLMNLSDSLPLLNSFQNKNKRKKNQKKSNDHDESK